jgi:hypothetical protein
MYEQSLKMPLIVKYPKEIKPAVNDEDMVLNLDFAATFLDYAGVEIPSDIQGESMRGILAGQPPSDWREAIYYRYYEYPAIHAVKRHYGVRTDRYKLIHFYYDVDYWELYDLENDPSEVNNLYDNPEYAELIATLKNKIAALQEQYQDTEGDQFLPQPDIEIDHLAKGAEVKLTNPYSKKYSGGSYSALTDGVRANDEGLLYSQYGAWQGFEGEDMEAIIDLKAEKTVKSISCGFLRKVGAWIFLPTKINYAVSTDGKNFTSVATTIIETESKGAPLERIEFEAIVKDMSVRYIKISAENIGVCPEWHAGAGGKAWIFADEITVK